MTKSSYHELDSPLGRLDIHWYAPLDHGPEWARRERLLVNGDNLHVHLFRERDGAFRVSDRDRQKFPTDTVAQLEKCLGDCAFAPEKASPPGEAPKMSPADPMDRLGEYITQGRAVRGVGNYARPGLDDHPWEGWSVRSQHWYLRTPEDWISGVYLYLCTSQMISFEDELIARSALDELARLWPGEIS